MIANILFVIKIAAKIGNKKQKKRVLFCQKHVLFCHFFAGWQNSTRFWQNSTRFAALNWRSLLTPFGARKIFHGK
jgi:hypothetical protein